MPSGSMDAEAEVAEALAARRSVWRERFERARYVPELWTGIALLLGYVAMAVTALLAYRGDASTLAVNSQWVNVVPLPGPSFAHPLGALGVYAGTSGHAAEIGGTDVLQALVRASPWDLALVGGILAGAMGVGVLLGAAAGLREGGAVDLAITSWSDVIVGVPPFLLVLLLFLNLDPLIGTNGYLLLFGLLFVAILWPYYARPVRALARQVTAAPFVEAAQASGAPPTRVLLRHIVPNSLSPALAQLPGDVANIFFVLTAFPFVFCFDLGLFPFTSPLPSQTFPEWGLLLADGTCSGYSVFASMNRWWMYVYPAVTIFVFGLAIALVSDGLQKVRTRRGRY